jgi:NAD(P)H-flavin reductase
MSPLIISNDRTDRGEEAADESSGVHCALVPLVTVPLARTLAVTPRSRLLQIDVRRVGFEFQPGQAVIVGERGQPERRPYSIACSPEQTRETGLLELLVSDESSRGSRPHLGSTAPGALIDVEGPLGAFTLPPLDRHANVLFVAGGTGIAPLRSMLDHILRRQLDLRIALLYSARQADEFAFVDEFQRHTAAGRLELHQTVTRGPTDSWSGHRGRIGRTHFEAVLHEPASTLCFVCGPELLVGESVATLRALGVPDVQIRTEQWSR